MRVMKRMNVSVLGNVEDSFALIRLSGELHATHTEEEEILREKWNDFVRDSTLF